MAWGAPRRPKAPPPGWPPSRTTASPQRARTSTSANRNKTWGAFQAPARRTRSPSRSSRGARKAPSAPSATVGGVHGIRGSTYLGSIPLPPTEGEADERDSAETRIERFGEIAGQVEELRQRALAAVEASEDLPQAFRDGLLALLHDLVPASDPARLNELYADEWRAPEVRALARLYGRWYLDVSRVGEAAEGATPGAYPLPSVTLVDEFLAPAVERKDDGGMIAARLDALGFLDRTGFGEAVLGRSLVESYERVREWNLASPGEREQPSDVLGLEAQLAILALQEDLEEVEDDAVPSRLAEAVGRLGAPGDDAPPTLLRLSVTGSAPATERSPSAPPALRPGASPRALVSGFDEVVGDLGPQDPGETTSGGPAWPFGIPMLLLGALAWGGIRALRRPAADPRLGGHGVSGPPEREPAPPPVVRDQTKPEFVDPRAITEARARSGDGQAGPATASAPGDHKAEATATPASLPAEAPSDPGRWGQLPVWLRSTLEPRLPARYTQLELIASGGMGSIVRARDEVLGRQVAIKVSPPHLVGVEEYRIRFFREARAMAQLQHRHIAQVHDVPEATEGEAPMMIMEYLEGRDLAGYLEQAGPASVAEVLTWLRQAGDALQYAHERGMLHRDIKPANIFLLDTGEVKVVDFGLVAFEDTPGLTLTGVRMGSLMFMPPEQLRGERVDTSADLYALAVSAYQVLSGELPFDHTEVSRMAVPHVSDAVAGVPPALDAALVRAMQYDPADRFPSIRAFLDALPEG